MELFKLLAANEVVAQIISFLVLLAILRFLLWKPVLKMLDDRKAKIADDFKQIEDVKKEVAGLKAEYEENMSSIQEVAKEKMREAIDEGRKAAEAIKKDAQQSAKAIIDDAKVSIEIEVAKARINLKKDIVDLTIQATEEIVQQKLTEEQDRKLVMDFLDKMDNIEK
ncbi:MAG: F0F1 ATP synthase subunit B [Candidatus Omnitrophica bacterium]|nr:F0F1 ATP synthase subunit B [Candidatus Omnitrophota bacterium]